MHKFALALLIVGAGLLWSASKPDYSGTWKLDPVRSRLAHEEDTKLVFKMEHNEPAIRIVVTDAKAENQPLELTTDGVEHDAQLDGRPAKVSAAWDQWGEDRLILTISQKDGSGEKTLVREFKLGDKGRILTTVMREKDGSGEKRAYEFFVKQ